MGHAASPLGVEAARRVPFIKRHVNNTVEPSSFSTARFRGGLEPWQNSMFFTSYFFVLSSIGKSFQIESQDSWWQVGGFHRPWAVTCCQLTHV